MRKVYIFGPIFISGEEYLPVYKALNKLCSNYFEKVIGTYPDFWDSKESPKDFYTRTYETIKDCDLFIVEVSSPSHGVGMELQIAQQQNIPVIAIVKNTIDISNSSMVLGLPVLKKTISYGDLADLLLQLEESLKSWK